MGKIAPLFFAIAAVVIITGITAGGVFLAQNNFLELNSQLEGLTVNGANGNVKIKDADANSDANGNFDNDADSDANADADANSDANSDADDGANPNANFYSDINIAGAVSAKTVVEEFYNAIGADNTKKAKKLLTVSAQNEFDELSVTSGDAAITAINFILIEENGKTATVCVEEELTGYDLKTKTLQVTYNLEIVDGVWKIASIIYSEEEI